MNLVRLEPMTENAQLVVTLSCPDRPGIVHAVTGVIGESGGNVIQSQQFGDSDTGTFFMRVEVDSPKGRAPIDEGLASVAEEFGATYRVDDLGRKLRTIIMVSREGHCLTDLLYRQQTQGLPIDVIAVVGNHPDLAPRRPVLRRPLPQHPRHEGHQGPGRAPAPRPHRLRKR